MMIELNQWIDHTKLGPLVTYQEIDKLIEEGITYDFKSLCVNSHFVSYVSEKLKNSSVLTCTVIGFPHGSHSKAAKVSETKQAIIDGADEIDMVLNLTFVKSKNKTHTYEEIKSVVDAAEGRDVKVILETCYLSNDEIILACLCAKEAGARFVKTSTGFGLYGATVEHVELMKKTVGDTVEVKASGGIKNKEDALKMIQAGATRLGTSKGVEIMQNKENQDANTTY
jgi:deoxyribose-phosphate aldolase